MENLLNWLASLLKVDVVWVEKDHGDWVKRRRYHPVTIAIVLVCVLFLAVSLGRAFFLEPGTPETEMEAPSAISLEPLEIETEQIEIVYFPDPVYDTPPYPGPIPADLEVADDEYWIRIIKGNFRLYLYRGQDLQKSRIVAVGRNPGDKERVGDARTPRGIFTVQSIYDSRAWLFDFGDGRGPVRGAYGPWFIRLRTGWRGIGIHGTNDPDSLGTMASDGCIRMRNDELEELMQFISINMKVVIEE